MSGRPTILTPDVQEKICNAIKAGNYYEAACAYAGISYAAFNDWIKRGEGRSKNRPANKVYVDFVSAVRLAEAASEVRVVTQWQQQIPEDWRAASTFLARRFPKRWANVEKVQINPQDVDAAIAAELAKLAGGSQAEDAGTAEGDASGQSADPDPKG